MAWALFKDAGSSLDFTLGASPTGDFFIQFIGEINEAPSSGFGPIIELSNSAGTEYLRISVTTDLRFKIESASKTPGEGTTFLSLDTVYNLRVRYVYSTNTLYAFIDDVAEYTVNPTSGQTWLPTLINGSFPDVIASTIHDECRYFDFGSVEHLWNPTDSDHSSTILTDTIGGNDATFVGMGVEAWIDLGGGAAELTIAATAKKPTVVASLGASLPQPIALINTTVKKPLVSSVFDVTLPQPSADVVVTTKKPTVLASLSATIPGFNTSISVTAKKPVANVDASATLPSPQMAIAVTAKKPIVALLAEATEPSFRLSISATAKKPTVALSASATLPQPELTIIATANKPAVLVRATVSGIDLEVGSDATLTYNEGSNELVYPAGSNTLKFRG